MQNLLYGMYVYQYLKFIDEWLASHDTVKLYTRDNVEDHSRYYFSVTTVDGKRYQRSINSPDAPVLMSLFKERQFYLRAREGLKTGNTDEFAKLFALMDSSAGLGIGAAGLGIGSAGLSTNGSPFTAKTEAQKIIVAGTSGAAIKPFAAKMTKDVFDRLRPANSQNIERGIKHGNFIVRSKAEDEAASIYDDFFMPIVYEPLIKIQNIEFKPDFAFFVPFLNEFFFHEHLGKIDDEQYLITATHKVSDYCRMGIWPGVNLLLTSEIGNAPISIEKLKADILSFVCKKIK